MKMFADAATALHHDHQLKKQKKKNFCSTFHYAVVLSYEKTN